jgi:hypothetical protein
MIIADPSYVLPLSIILPQQVASPSLMEPILTPSPVPMLPAVPNLVVAGTLEGAGKGLRSLSHVLVKITPPQAAGYHCFICTSDAVHIMTRQAAGNLTRTEINVLIRNKV